MQLSELIKQATDILANHGDIFVDIEIIGEDRYSTKYIDIQRKNSTSKEVIAIIAGKDKDNYK